MNYASSASGLDWSCQNAAQSSREASQALLPTLATVWENVCVLLYMRWIAHDTFVYNPAQIMGTLNIWSKIIIIHFLQQKKKPNHMKMKKANNLLNYFIFLQLIRFRLHSPIFANIPHSLCTECGSGRLRTFPPQTASHFPGLGFRCQVSNAVQPSRARDMVEVE